MRVCRKWCWLNLSWVVLFCAKSCIQQPKIYWHLRGIHILEVLTPHKYQIHSNCQLLRTIDIFMCRRLKTSISHRDTNTLKLPTLKTVKISEKLTSFTLQNCHYPRVIESLEVSLLPSYQCLKGTDNSKVTTLLNHKFH